MSPEMYSADSERRLRQIAAVHPGLAARLRRLRDRIASGKASTDAPCQEILDRSAQEKKEMPPPILDAIERGRDEHGRKLVQITPMMRLETSISAGRRLIALCGEPGTGKTYTACQWLYGQASGLFVQGAAISVLNRNWSPDRGEIWRYKQVRNLVIDDIGRGVSGRDDAGRLEDFLCDRHEGGYITVCATNLTPEKFAKIYGARVASRLQEVGGFVACDEIVRRGGGK